MANALEKALGVEVVPHVTEQSKPLPNLRKQRKKSRTQQAIEYMSQTGATQYAAARKFCVTPSAISYQRRLNTLQEYCPHCGAKYPAYKEI